jgi:hypothetical protein
MSRVKVCCSVVLALQFLAITANVSADVVTNNLAVWLDAADYNADGVAGMGTGSTWKNLAATGSTYNATLAADGTGSLPVWAGNGTAGNPYRVEFRYANNMNGGYATIANSNGGSTLDTGVFTYEIWARRNGVGADTGFGSLIGHATSDAGSGNGGIYHRPDDNFYSLGGNPGAWAQFPSSAGDFATTGYHQIVLARAGDGNADSAYYLDGELQGTFQSSSNTSVDSLLTIAARDWVSGGTTYHDWNMDMDVAGVRVYTAALSGSDVLQNFQAGISVATIPEPGSLILVASGAAGLLAYAWRKRG